MLNRHGLIAGATGTGKTKTLQLLAGQLSKAGVPVFVADIKGDLTGLAAPGDATNPKVVERVHVARLDLRAVGPPGRVPVAVGQARAPRSGRPSTRSGRCCSARSSTSTRRRPRSSPLVFKYCDDNDLPLLDLKDLATTLKFLSSDEGKPILADYGGMSSASVGVLLRSIVVLEQEGADVFFGEPEFDVEDLLRTTPEGEGDHQRPRAVGRHGQAPAVLDVHALDAGPAVRVAARGRRPAQAQAVLLLRRGAPAVRRRVRGAAWTRSSGRRGSSARRASASTS